MNDKTDIALLPEKSHNERSARREQVIHIFATFTLHLAFLVSPTTTANYDGRVGSARNQARNYRLRLYTDGIGPVLLLARTLLCLSCSLLCGDATDEEKSNSSTSGGIPVHNFRN